MIFVSESLAAYFHFCDGSINEETYIDMFRQHLAPLKLLNSKNTFFTQSNTKLVCWHFWPVPNKEWVENFKHAIMTTPCYCTPEDELKVKQLWGKRATEKVRMSVSLMPKSLWRLWEGMATLQRDKSFNIPTLQLVATNELKLTRTRNMLGLCTLQKNKS